MKNIAISKTNGSRIKVSFPYNPSYIAKVKTIEEYRWHPEEKYWSFTNTNGTLEKILKVFEGEKIHIDPVLQTELSSVIVRSGVTKQSHNGLGISFEDLRRELVSRKYSYKTVKSYIYYNRDLFNFTNENPSDINDNDIKNYLFHLAEEKQVATSTLNQAINALKFYYGMPKKKFVYEVKKTS